VEETYKIMKIVDGNIVEIPYSTLKAQIAREAIQSYAHELALVRDRINELLQEDGIEQKIGYYRGMFTEIAMNWLKTQENFTHHAMVDAVAKKCQSTYTPLQLRNNSYALIRKLRDSGAIKARTDGSWMNVNYEEPEEVEEEPSESLDDASQPVEDR